MPMCDLIGIPFLDGGRSRKGADCWGVLMLAYEVLKGKKLPDYGLGCGAFLSQEVFKRIREQQELGPWTPIGGAEEGAIVLIQNDPVFVNHVGLCIDSFSFLHTLQKTGSVIDRFKPFWGGRVRGFYRYGG